MIYLLHATVPLGGTGAWSARHYLGWCRPGGLENRLRQHRSGRSQVKIIRAFLDAGATLLLVALWPTASLGDERRLKRLGHAKRWCPLCNPSAPMGAGLVMPSRKRSRPALTQRSPRPESATGGA